MTLTIKLKRLNHGKDLPWPQYATPGSAGADLHAAIMEDVILEPGDRHLIPSGFAAAIPAGYELQIRSRSGLSLKQGLMVLNSPATIDEDYRGEIKVILCNLGQEPVTITRGMRIAQLLLAPTYRADWQEVGELPEHASPRDASGFGSTGLYTKS